MKKLILVGAGGHSKACIDVIEQENIFQIFGLIDLKKNIGKKVLGYPIIDCDENLSKYVSDDTYFFVSIAQIKTAEKRNELFNMLKGLNAKIATIISPLAYVSKHATIGDGTIIMHNAVINASACIGKNCIINSKALIEHDVVINDCCHISTGAIVNGFAVVEKKCFLGSNSVVVNCGFIPEESFVKAGSLVK